MEVRLSPEIEAKLTRLAAQRGSDAETLARNAVESFVNYDEWFLHEVDKGLTQIDRGEVLTHEEVGVRIENILGEERPRR